MRMAAKTCKFKTHRKLLMAHTRALLSSLAAQKVRCAVDSMRCGTGTVRGVSPESKLPDHATPERIKKHIKLTVIKIPNVRNSNP